jgi:putative tryptophan/tyrosine transport system substrate-binding protein
VKRRDFIALIGSGVAFLPRVARAQQPPKSLSVGITSIQPRTSPPYAAFDRRLRELGYIEGQSLAVEFVNPDAVSGGIGEAMKKLVRRKVDVIVAPNESAVKSALAATDSIPIVMIAIDYDPLARGYVKSLARQGGNVTGLFLQQIELATKRLQLLKDAFPNLRAATMFWDEPSAEQWRVTDGAAAALGVKLAGIRLDEPPYDYERALARAPPEYRDALVMPISSVFYRDRQRLSDFALHYRMASIFVLREFVEVGGLLSYGASFPAMFGRAAEYVDKIAKGAKPADLPVEQPTKFDLILNLKTATALGIEVPGSLLARADEVIE